MIRLILRLLGIKDFEVCASCETLKKQIDFVNSEKKELMETLILLTKPNVQVQTGETKVVNPVVAQRRFSQQKAILENMHRTKAEIVKTSPFIAQADGEKKPPVTIITPETIEAMEDKLGLNDENVNAS